MSQVQSLSLAVGGGESDSAPTLGRACVLPGALRPSTTSVIGDCTSRLSGWLSNWGRSSPGAEHQPCSWPGGWRPSSGRSAGGRPSTLGGSRRPQLGGGAACGGRGPVRTTGSGGLVPATAREERRDAPPTRPTFAPAGSSSAPAWPRTFAISRTPRPFAAARSLRPARPAPLVARAELLEAEDRYEEALDAAAEAPPRPLEPSGDRGQRRPAADPRTDGRGLPPPV